MGGFGFSFSDLLPKCNVLREELCRAIFFDK
jgi:hypothetical protein